MLFVTVIETISQEFPRVVNSLYGVASIIYVCAHNDLLLR